MASIAHEQNIICSKTLSEGDTTHERPTICGQLFASHVVNSQPMKRNQKDAASDNANYLTSNNNDRPFTQPGHTGTNIGHPGTRHSKQRDVKI